MKVKILVFLSCLLILAGCGTATTQKQTGTDLRVATWNIGANPKSDVAKMSEQITSNKIEIIGLQEVDVNNGRNDYDMLSQFKTEDYKHLHWAKGRDFSNGHFGLGVVSKMPFLQSSSIPIESTSSNATKVIERVEFEKDGKHVSFYNLHLSWENEQLRKRQYQELMDRVAIDQNPYIIIVGDFNADQNNKEYKMFTEQLNLVNGNRDRWIDTFPDKEADPDMKSYSIDNILVTKNIKIGTFSAVHSDLSDHDMFYSDLVLLDDPQTNIPSLEERNIALGQSVITKPVSPERDNYMLVDGITNSNWTAKGEQEIVLELDKSYDLSQVKLFASEVKLETAKVSFSETGEYYTNEREFNLESEVNLEVNQNAQYLKFEFEGKPDLEYKISDIQVFGTPTATKEVVRGNILSNELNQDELGSLNSGWYVSQSILESYQPLVTNSGDGINISNLSQEGTTRITQSVKIKASHLYKLNFSMAGGDVNSKEFTLKIQQYDKQGTPIPQFTTRLRDNFLISEDAQDYVFSFTSAPNVDTVNISFEFKDSSGTFTLNALTLEEARRTQSLIIEGNNTMKVNETVNLKPVVYPAEANDYNYRWISSDETIASVDASGNVTAHQSGDVKISRISIENLTLEASIYISID